jgi:hypothetical protein
VELNLQALGPAELGVSIDVSLDVYITIKDSLPYPNITHKGVMINLNAGVGEFGRVSRPIGGHRPALPPLQRAFPGRQGGQDDPWPVGAR